MKKILVICSKNKIRSPTFVKIYKNDSRFKIRSAGLSLKSPHTLSYKDLMWADLILYMERKHLEKIKKKFIDIILPPTINMEIEDYYKFMDSELIKDIQIKMEMIIRKEIDFSF
jgi:predicted protein tyrosine phosphatase